MKHVYVVAHEANNSNWIEVYATLKDARTKVKSLIKEHTDDGVDFDTIDIANDMYHSDSNEVFIAIHKEKVL